MGRKVLAVVEKWPLGEVGLVEVRLYYKFLKETVKLCGTSDFIEIVYTTNK